MRSSVLQRVPRSREDILAWQRAREREIASRPDPEWRNVSIPIDGESIEFLFLAEGSRWVAHGRVDDLRLILHGRDFPFDEVELISVKDIEPYIEGSRRLALPNGPDPERRAPD